MATVDAFPIWGEEHASSETGGRTLLCRGQDPLRVLLLDVDGLSQTQPPALIQLTSRPK
jgi:hypothetical protein